MKTNSPCFAETDKYKNGCDALNKSLCNHGQRYDNCPFYKTPQQHMMDRREAYKRNKS